MQSPATMTAPGSNRQPSQGRRPEVFILSSDDALLIELGPALGDRFRSRPVEQLEELNASDSRWLGIIDASSRADGRALVARIEQNHPQAPLIVIVADGQESQWQQALARGSVCHVLTRDQLDSPALNEALLLAEQRLRSGSTGQTPPPNARSLPVLPIAMGAGVLVVVLAAALWWLLRTPEAAPVAARTAAPAIATQSLVTRTPAATEQRSVFELLSAARVAFRDQDLWLPRAEGPARGDSALELYALALQAEPQNEEALDGLRRLHTVARNRMQSDLSAGRLEEAQRTVGIFKSAGFDPEAVKAMEADITAARPKLLLVQARRAIASGDITTATTLLNQAAASGADRNAVQELRTSLDARQQDQQLADMASGVRAAIAAGNLLEPATGNARAQVLAMRQQNRNSPVVLATQRELQLALVARGRDALQAQQPEAAQRYATAAAEFGNGAELTELRRQIQADGERVASAAAAAVAAPAPPPAPAPAAAAPRPAAVSYVVARAARPLSVEYPEIASRNNVTGYVVVEFLLNPDGSAKNVHVVEAQPQGIFDRSAMNAVARGRFDIASLGPEKQPRIARIRLSFKPS